MRKLWSTILMVTVFILMLGGTVGCVSGLNSTTDMWNAAGPVSKAVFFNEVYSEQWDQYLVVIGYAIGLTADEVEVMAKSDPVKLKGLLDASKLSKEAREMLRHKKAILKKVEKPIDIFSDLANSGLNPTESQEEFIVELLNQLKYKMYMSQ